VDLAVSGDTKTVGLELGFLGMPILPSKPGSYQI
jgi:hypothetical protein